MTRLAGYEIVEHVSDGPSARVYRGGPRGHVRGRGAVRTHTRGGVIRRGPHGHPNDGRHQRDDRRRKRDRDRD